MMTARNCQSVRGIKHYDDEFNELMDGAGRSSVAGKCVPFEEFDSNIRQELGI